MGHFSVETCAHPGSTLSANQHIEGVLPHGKPVSAAKADADQRLNEAWLRLGMGFHDPRAGNATNLRPGLDLDATYPHSSDANETGTDVGLVLEDTGQGIFAATPTIRLAVDTMPSLAPRTAARSQPMRDTRCVSG
jgi:hypothetical protein